MDKDQIIAKIQEGLKQCCTMYNIEPSKIRVKMTKTGGAFGGINCHLMSGTKMLTKEGAFEDFNEVTLKENKYQEIKISALLNLNPITAKIASSYLVSTIKKLADENKISHDKVNARLYILPADQQTFYPSVYLYENGKAIKAITMQELMGSTTQAIESTPETTI